MLFNKDKIRSFLHLTVAPNSFASVLELSLKTWQVDGHGHDICVCVCPKIPRKHLPWNKHIPAALLAILIIPLFNNTSTSTTELVSCEMSSPSCISVLHFLSCNQLHCQLWTMNGFWFLSRNCRRIRTWNMLQVVQFKIMSRCYLNQHCDMRIGNFITEYKLQGAFYWKPVGFTPTYLQSLQIGGHQFVVT